MINDPRKQAGVSWKSQQLKEAESEALGERKWSPAYQGWGRVMVGGWPRGTKFWLQRMKCPRNLMEL